MPTRRASSATIAFSPEGKRQPDFATAMQLTNLTASLPDTAKNLYRYEQTREEILDCSAEELFTRITTGQIGSLTLEFDAAPETLAVLLAYALGVAAAPSGSGPYTHQITELPVGAYQPPPFSLVHGFRGGATPLLLRGCVINSITIRGQARQRVTGSAEIRFAEATPASGFVLPPCVNFVPLRMSDCDLLRGATSLAAGLRSFEFSYSNELLTRDHPFTAAAAIPTRLERADRRTRRLTFAVLGDDSDALFADALSGVADDFTLQLGPASNRVTIQIPNGLLDLDGGGLQKDGEANETVIRALVTPAVNATTTPVEITAINNQSTAYLQAG